MQADPMKMTPGEQDAVDIPHQGTGEHKKNPMGKVKDKVKKLTTKIKSKTKKNKHDEHSNEVQGRGSSSSSSEDEADESPQTQEKKPGDEYPRSTGYGGAGYGGATPESQKDGEVHGGEQYKSRDLVPSEGLQVSNMQSSADPSAPAPGQNWPSSHHEPRAATSETPFGDETHKRQNEVPSALGGESAGVAAGLAGFGSRDKEEKPHDMDRDDKVPQDVITPKSTEGYPSDRPQDTGRHDTYESSRDIHPSDTAAGSKVQGSQENIPESIMKPVTDGVDSSGRDYVSSEVTGDKAGDERPSYEQDSSTQPKGWMDSVKNVFGAKLATSPKTSSSAPNTPSSGPEFTTSGGDIQNKTWTDKARESALSMKDTIASKLPTSTAPQDKPVTEKTADSAANTEQKAADTGSNITQRAVETATGLKDTVASKLGYGQAGQTQSEVGPTVTSDTTAKSGPTMTEKLTGVKDTVASKLGYGANTNNTTGTTTESVGTPGEKTDSTGRYAPGEHETALSEKITNMLTLGGSKNKGSETASSPTGSSPVASETTTAEKQAQGGGVYDKVTGMVGSLLGGKKTEDKTPRDPDVVSGDVAMTGH